MLEQRGNGKEKDGRRGQRKKTKNGWEVTKLKRKQSIFKKNVKKDNWKRK